MTVQEKPSVFQQNSTIVDTAHHPLADGNPPAWASGWGEDRYGVWTEFTIENERIKKTVTQRLRWILPGRFRMGSPDDEPGRYDDEGSRHEVTIANGFWLFDTPVTQELWLAVMEKNPSRFQTPDRPVERVKWHDCQEFLTKFNERMGDRGPILELPSEAWWEYSCRVDEPGAIYSGSLEIIGDGNAPALHEIAWYGGNSGEDFALSEGHTMEHLKNRQFDSNPCGSHPVAQKRANQWGLYDMLGNVWEWTADTWHNSYEDAPVDGKPWDDGKRGTIRVVRGGSWFGRARLCRSACRSGYEPVSRIVILGFRCCARVQV